MDNVRQELNEWRTAVAVKRTFDKLNPPPIFKATEPPKAYIRTISDSGLIRVGFTESVYIVPDMRMINNGTIYMSELQMLGGGNYHRELIWSKEAD